MHGLASIDAEGFEALRKQTERWRGFVADIAAEAGLRGPLRPYERGSNLVARVGDEHLIKVFPRIHDDQFTAEHPVLTHLAAHPPEVPVPELIASGERDGWRWLAMTHLPGTLIEDVWADLPEAEKRWLLERLGALIAAFQKIPVDGLALEPRWGPFLVAQRAGCHARHERVKTPAHLRADLERYLSSTEDVMPEAFSPVLLTGEWTPENVLLSRRGGAWEITGVVDFADSMIGFGEYDVLGPGLFLAGGDEERVRRLLTGYGYGAADLTEDLRKRLLRLFLLHRYSHPRAQVRIPGWEDRVRDLDELERFLWPFG